MGGLTAAKVTYTPKERFGTLRGIAARRRPAWKRLGGIAAAILIGLRASDAGALLTYEIRGEVVFVDFETVEGIWVGDMVTLAASIDPSTAEDGNLHESFGDYPILKPGHVALVVERPLLAPIVVVCATGRIEVDDDFSSGDPGVPRDVFLALGFDCATENGDLSMSTVSAMLTDDEALVFSGDALPTGIPLGQFEHATIGAVGDDFQPLLTAEITHVTVVPEPARAVGAALLALTGIAARRRKGRVQSPLPA